MADTTAGSCIWKGDLGKPEGHKGKSIIKDVTDKAALLTFITAMKATITDCTVDEYALITARTYGIAPPGTDVNVDLQGVFVIRDDVYNTISRYKVGGLKAANIVKEAAGDRIIPSIVAQFALAVETFSGRSQTGLQGYVIQRK